MSASFEEIKKHLNSIGIKLSDKELVKYLKELKDSGLISYEEEVDEDI